MSLTIEREDVKAEEDERREEDDVDDPDRGDARQVAAADSHPLQQSDGRVESEREEDRRDDPLQGRARVKDGDREQNRERGAEQRDEDDLRDRARLDLVGAHRRQARGRTGPLPGTRRGPPHCYPRAAYRQVYSEGEVYMAYEVNANGAIAKVRNPWGVLGLGLITLGIYNIVWYYKINKEFKEYGAVQGDQELADSNPTNSVLAVTLGALIIVPAIISFYNTVKRAQRVQQLGGVEPMNGWIVLILLLVISPAVYPYMQSELNKLWERYPSLTEGGGAIPAGTQQPARSGAAAGRAGDPSAPASARSVGRGGSHRRQGVEPWPPMRS